MRRRRRGLVVPEDSPGMSEINITPLTDVLLVLLVIFLLTATAAHRFGFQVGSGGEERVAEVLVVRVLEGGDLTVDDRPVALEDLRTDGPVVVSAEDGALYGRVVEVIDALRQAGAESVSLQG